MISDCNALLEKAFNVLNKVYFENKLPQPVITIQSSPRAYGYITLDKVWSNSTGGYHEINISAEYLNRPIINVFATLQHEMCHLYSMVNGIADTSKNGKYHNKNFKVIAEERGLQIEYVKYIGYSKTTPTKEFIDILKKYGLLDNTFDYFRGALPPPVDDNKISKKKKSSTRKYICPSCGISVRATKDVNIACIDCNNIMIKVD